MNNAADKADGKSTFREALPILVKILLMVLVCDAVLMVFLGQLSLSRPWNITVNLILLAVLVTPLLYRFVVRPVRVAAEQRKLMEEARLLKQQYEDLIRNVPVAVYSALPDETGTTTFMSDRWEEWTGHSPEEFYRDRETWPNSIHPEDRSKAVQAYIEACKEGKEYVSEYRLVHKDTGEIRYLRDHGVPIKDEKGNVVRMDGIVTDITERVQIEERLRESERRFRNLFESSQDGILAYDTGFRHTMWNHAMEEITGITADEIMGKIPWEAFSFLEEVGEADALRDAVRGKASMQQVKPYDIPETGRRGYFESAHFPLYDAEGRIVGGMAVIRDVTERKRAEEEIENLARFPSESPAPIMRIAADGTVLYANNMAQPLLAARGSGTDQAAPPEWRELVGAVLASGTTQMTEVQHGKQIFALSVVPLPEAGYVNLYGTDVTELRQKEDQLRQAAKMEAIGRLAGGVAHDFNNYLAAIEGYIELILEEVSPAAPCREYLQQIAKTAGNATQLTKQLLAFGRRAVVRPRVLNLNSIVGETAGPLERLLGENINLVVRQASDLGNVQADPGQVQQIVMNLAINARDAMSRGGMLTIETANIDLDEAYVQEHPDASTGPHVMLAVADNGVGIDEESLEHVFEPFFTTKRASEGAGLGLATVHGIMTQSGGHVTVESRPGAGATFRSYFPRVEMVEEVETKPPARPAPSAGAETILVVEDEKAVRSFLVRALELSGYAVLSAGSPKEALAIARELEQPLHLMNSDVIMHEMNGPELGEKLAETHPGIPVIYISGYPKDAIPDRSIAEAEIELLPKPFTPDELREKVRQTLDAVAAEG